MFLGIFKLNYLLILNENGQDLKRARRLSEDSMSLLARRSLGRWLQFDGRSITAVEDVESLLQKLSPEEQSKKLSDLSSESKDVGFLLFLMSSGIVGLELVVYLLADSYLPCSSKPSPRRSHKSRSEPIGNQLSKLSSNFTRISSKVIETSIGGKVILPATQRRNLYSESKLTRRLSESNLRLIELNADEIGL